MNAIVGAAVIPGRLVGERISEEIDQDAADIRKVQRATGFYAPQQFIFGFLQHGRPEDRPCDHIVCHIRPEVLVQFGGHLVSEVGRLLADAVNHRNRDLAAHGSSGK